MVEQEHHLKEDAGGQAVAVQFDSACGKLDIKVFRKLIHSAIYPFFCVDCALGIVKGPTLITSVSA